MASELTARPSDWVGGGRKIKLHHFFYFLAASCVAVVVAFATIRPIQVLPRVTLAPGFSLTDENGDRLTSEDFRGKIVLYNFTYTHCQEPCPQTGQVMRQVQERLSEVDSGGIPIELVTISFDPERDTPEALQRYADALGADLSRWHFATGLADRLKWIIGGGFGLYYKQAEDGSFRFDPGFVLVDGAGILRAEYRTATPDVDIILRDFRLIVQEAQNSEGAYRYAYEAAHLFLCYPR